MTPIFIYKLITKLLKYFIKDNSSQESIVSMINNVHTLYLRRLINNTNFDNLNCILGNVYDSNHRKICVSLELPDKNNANDISCIPTGVYKCVPDDTGKHQYFRIKDVPNRDRVEIHIGNRAKDLEGCIALGAKWSMAFNQGFIRESEDTLEILKKKYPKGFILDIRNEFVD